MGFVCRLSVESMLCLGGYVPVAVGVFVWGGAVKVGVGELRGGCVRVGVPVGMSVDGCVRAAVSHSLSATAGETDGCRKGSVIVGDALSWAGDAVGALGGVSATTMMCAGGVTGGVTGSGGAST